MSHFLEKILDVWWKELQEVMGRSCKEVKEKHTKKYLETHMWFSLGLVELVEINLQGKTLKTYLIISSMQKDSVVSF